ncbi:alpha/beta hydrolase [Acidothermaceae bacterium B102]|nr:alpha/beta hydrolase [Acidothermaceae bacterium B102]
MHDSHPLPGTDVLAAGLRVHVVRHGADTHNTGGLPIVLLHGLPTSSYLWHDVMRDLERQHPMVAPDLLGFGRSERPARRERYALEAQARLMLQVLDELAIPRAAIVGHGLGGTVAVHMTAIAPERVAGLVLVHSPLHPETWPTPPVLPLLIPGLRTAYVRAMQLFPSLAGRVVARSLRAEYEPAELHHYVNALLGTEGGRGLLDFVSAVDLDAAALAWQEVREIAPPTLVLWAEDNHLLSTTYGRRLALDVPGAAWVPIGGSGQLLPQDRPERVAEEIAGFVAELSPVEVRS